MPSMIIAVGCGRVAGPTGSGGNERFGRRPEHSDVATYRAVDTAPGAAAFVGTSSGSGPQRLRIVSYPFEYWRCDLLEG